MFPTSTTSKPTLENVVSVIQQLTASVNYEFINLIIYVTILK